MALDAFLFSHHDIQTIIFRAGRSVLMYYLTQVSPKCCINTESTIMKPKHLGTMRSLSDVFFTALIIFICPADSPMELQRSIGLEEWCRDGKRESGRQHLSFTNRAFLGGQVKYRVPLKVPSVQPGHSSSWRRKPVDITYHKFCLCNLYSIQHLLSLHL